MEGTDHQGQVRQHVLCGGHSVGNLQEVVNAFDEVSGLHRGKSADDSRCPIQGWAGPSSFFYAGSGGGAGGSADRATRDADHAESILVRAGVEETVGFVLDQSIAEPTQRRYASAWKKYSDWCSQLGEAPLPITEEKAMAYVITLTREGLRVGKVKYHLASIRMAQIKAGMAGPD